MNITKLAFDYRKSVLLIIALLIINGVYAYFTLPAQEDPSITVREVIVTTTFPGMSAQRVEQLITKKLEEELIKIPELKEINSSSANGLSTVHVIAQDRYFNLDEIWQDVRNKVSAAYAKMPEGTQTPYVNDEFGDVSVITLALTSDGFSQKQSFDIAQHIRDTLYGVNGTKKVEILGQQPERVFLEVSNAKLAQLGISPDAILQELQNQNIIRSGGNVDIGLTSFIVEPSGNFTSIADIADTFINLPNSDNFIALKDIVTIKHGYVDPPNKLAYFNGEPALFFAIAMLDEHNILEYAPRLMQQVAQISATLPIGYQLHVATYQAQQVEETIESVSVNVVQTLAIVLVVVILFLGVRMGLIVGAIVPAVMLVALTIMQLTEMKLERMSLATLIISLGLLVDNGIVIAEDFKRRLEEGVERYQAMIQGSTELAIPLLSSSATTILVFLPLMLAEHAAGEYTRSVSLVVLITLLVSWVLALCLTPMLCYFFVQLAPPAGTQQGTEKPNLLAKISGHYEHLLHWVLSHKALFLASMLALLLASGFSMQFVAKQFFPDSDRSQILINVDLPAGTSARETNRQMEAIFNWINHNGDLDYVDSYSGYVGFSGPRFVLSLSPEDPVENKGFIVVNVAEGQDLYAIAQQLDRDLESAFPNVAIRAKKMFLGPSDSSIITVQVKGPDADVIYRKAQQIMDVFHQVPNTVDIHNNWENLTIKVEVQIDQHRAKLAGITSNDIAKALQSYFVGVQVTEYRDGDEIIPLIMRANNAERHSLDRMRTINVYSAKTGNAVPLFQVANFVPVNQFSSIHHEQLFKTVSVEARNTEMAAEDLKLLVDEKIDQLRADLPPNHSIEYDGVITDSIDAQQAMNANMPMVLGIILILLVLQFNSYRKTAIVALTIPLSFIGAAIGLHVMSASFGFMVILGIYSLAGIIVNNAIVLLDRIKIERDNGSDHYQAVINSCITRLRPITMATITTIAGLLPLILTQDPLFYGMANVMAFGLGIGTILTLCVVPSLYCCFYKVQRS
ncbi:efflux RND transporter permease subunit [uncultured Ferrimonas sp.]|uniref:efflux RND transporter permease subunit n=1 Tax=uncultured Ferrimonas sp. TaxID=432640 RepID=UPI0026083BE2|nr:efflux RND transporter permease subunit [uncultured Ferrimonas sp.]